MTCTSAAGAGGEAGRQNPVKADGAAVREPSTALDLGQQGRFLDPSVSVPNLFQEFAMADLAFVLTTVALFVLVAFVAKGVTKL
ncbi:hypothetical protein GCM10027074_54190 [Streptomyces deserti]